MTHPRVSGGPSAQPLIILSDGWNQDGEEDRDLGTGSGTRKTDLVWEVRQPLTEGSFLRMEEACSRGAVRRLCLQPAPYPDPAALQARAWWLQVMCFGYKNDSC